MNISFKSSNLWSFSMGAKIRPKYIPPTVLEPESISSTRQLSAKKAILWLLSKSPHSVEEIADHFEMSPKLVKHLLKELMENNLVSKESQRAKRYKISPKRSIFKG